MLVARVERDIFFSEYGVEGEGVCVGLAERKVGETFSNEAKPRLDG